MAPGKCEPLYTLHNMLYLLQVESTTGTVAIKHWINLEGSKVSHFLYCNYRMIYQYIPLKMAMLTFFSTFLIKDWQKLVLPVYRPGRSKPCYKFPQNYYPLGKIIYPCICISLSPVHSLSSNHPESAVLVIVVLRLTIDIGFKYFIYDIIL